MTDFAKTNWNETDYAKEYLDNAWNYLPDRNLQLQILISFYRHYVGAGNEKRVLDLGCGDGIISALIISADPNVKLLAVDGSDKMITAARKRLPDLPEENIQIATFQDLISESVTLGTFDCVVSGFAIHHIDLAEKEALFRWIFRHLSNKGSFVNLDVVLPSDARNEDWYYDLWREWIERHRHETKVGNDFSSVPSEARSRPENKYDILADQLKAMKAAGFMEVECHYRYGIFGIYSGTKT